MEEIQKARDVRATGCRTHPLHLASSRSAKAQSQALVIKIAEGQAKAEDRRSFQTQLLKCFPRLNRVKLDLVQPPCWNKQIPNTRWRAQTNSCRVLLTGTASRPLPMQLFPCRRLVQERKEPWR